MDSPRPEASSQEEATVHVGKTPQTADSLSAGPQAAPKTGGMRMRLPKLRKGTKISAIAEDTAASWDNSVVLKV